MLSSLQAVWSRIITPRVEQVNRPIHSTRDLLEALATNNGRYVVSEAGELDEAILEDAEARGLIHWHLAGGPWSDELRIELTSEGKVALGL